MSSLGLLQFRSASDLSEEEALQREQEEQERRRARVESSLTSHIHGNWQKAKMAKADVECRMLDCLRRRKGEYDPDKLREIQKQGGSAIYMTITGTKCRAASAWVRDILMPSNERPWGLEPTPVADIPEPHMRELSRQVEQQAQQMAQQGEQPDMVSMLEDAREQLRNRVQEQARKAADRHEDRIADQLAEGGWEAAFEGFIDDFVTYPGAVLKGPVMRRVPTLAWQAGWRPIKTHEIRPEFERVSPFDLYPSPDGTNIDDAAYLLERIRYTRGNLNQLRGVPGYNDEALDKVLSEYGQGGLKNWLWSDGERAELEGRGTGWLSDADTIDGLQYWGSAQGLMLLEWGISPEEIEDPLAEYEIEAVLIGTHVVRCVINRDPLGKRPYHKASYQPVPGSFWGQAIPELMDDIQDTCNATARSLVNNLAISSGPQVEVTDRLQSGEDPSDLYPWRIWRTKSSMIGANDPAVRFYQPSSNANELMGVYEKFEIKADDATNIPRYAYGNEDVGGAGNTASGLHMLMESANKGIKDSIRHIDRGVIKRVIEALWLHNMLYSSDHSIKGDCKAVPRGSSAMLMREQHHQLRQQFMQLTANDIDMSIIGQKGRAKLLRSLAEQLDIPDLVPDDREIDQQQARQQQAQQKSQQLQEMKERAEAMEKQASAKESQADAAQTEAETQEARQKAPLEERKLMVEILKQLQELNGDGANISGMESALASGQFGRRRGTSGHSGQNAGAQPRQSGRGEGADHPSRAGARGLVSGNPGIARQGS